MIEDDYAGSLCRYNSYYITVDCSTLRPRGGMGWDGVIMNCAKWINPPNPMEKLGNTSAAVGRSGSRPCVAGSRQDPPGYAAARHIRAA